MKETSSVETQQLLVDIYSMTGQKVEINDPLVAAALIQSYLIKKSGNDTSISITQSFENSSNSLLKELRSEIENLRNNFSNDTQKALEKMRKEVEAAPLKSKLPNLLASLFIFTMGILFGGFMGKELSERNFAPVVPQDEKVIAAGQDFLMIIPRLDSEMRVKIEREIQKARKQTQPK
jgi:hypothetical protein